MEAGLRWNLRVSAVRVELTDIDMHTLTRESQEVMVGLMHYHERDIFLEALHVIIYNSTQVAQY